MVLSLLTSILFVFDNICIQNHWKQIQKTNFFFLNYATANLTEFVEWPKLQAHLVIIKCMLILWSLNCRLILWSSTWLDGAEVSASGWGSGGPRFQSHPRLTFQSCSRYQLNQLGSKAASESTFKKSNTCGVSNTRLYFFTFLWSSNACSSCDHQMHAHLVIIKCMLILWSSNACSSCDHQMHAHFVIIKCMLIL